MQKLTPVKVLSIRQPWAWLIVNGYKGVENRSWNTQHRGRTLIHAGKTMTKQDWQDAVDVVNQSGVPDLLQLMEYEKPFILDQRVLPFTPLKGRLGFFNHYIDDSQSFAAP